MRRSFLLLAAAAILAVPVSAKMTTVKGAKCGACHTAMPPKKDNLNKEAAAMLVKYKTEASCKDCHVPADAKLGLTDKGKAAKAK
jgi:nitrate/TMAO reductase-like tetraheme cytochrome c subunit